MYEQAATSQSAQSESKASKIAQGNLAVQKVEPLAKDNIVDHSLKAQKAAQLQAVADRFVDKKQPIQRKNNTGLPDNLKSGIENLSGYSMDDVKVHYNSDKPAQLQAHAYAQGNQIHIAPGQEKHLPHEAWHVVQQKQGRVRPTTQLKAKVNINDDEGLEKEADVMGAKAMQTSFNATRVLNNSRSSIQRVIQLVNIQFGDGTLDIDNSMNAAAIIAALGYQAPKFMGAGRFSEEISEEDARRLYDELKDHPDAESKLEDLIEDLKSIADIDDEEEDEEDEEDEEEDEKDEKDEKGKNDDDDDDDDDEEDAFQNINIIGQIDRANMSPERREIQKLIDDHDFSISDAKKIITAKKVQALFSDWGGKTVYLSGGGAIALFAKHREIEDLDFRINAQELDGNTSWYELEAENEWVPNEFLIELNDKLDSEEKFENVPRGKRPNATNTRTVGVDNFENSGIEVSITIVTSDRETTEDEGIGVTRLTKQDLLEDKLKTAISRNKFGDKYINKVSKDIYDALTVYASIYDHGTIDEDRIKEHLENRSVEFRASNTEQNKDFISQTSINELVTHMFNRLIMAAKGAFENGDKLKKLLAVHENLEEILDSLIKMEIEPEIDDLTGDWFRVVAKGAAKKIDEQEVRDEIIDDIIEKLSTEFIERIDGPVQKEQSNPLAGFAHPTAFPPEFLEETDDDN